MALNQVSRSLRGVLIGEAAVWADISQAFGAVSDFTNPPKSRDAGPLAVWPALLFTILVLSHWKAGISLENS
jgi:hypothetical protein